MKTIRTIIATLSGVLLTFALVAWFSVRRNAAFIQRTIYQGFEQTFVVALVMGSAFLLIAIILTVAIVSTEEDDEDEEYEDELPLRASVRPRSQYAMERRPASQRNEQPYRRVSRTRDVDDRPSRREEESDFIRPRTRTEERQTTHKKRERVAERLDEMDMDRAVAPVKREKKAPRLQPEAEPSDLRPKAKTKRAEPEAAPKAVSRVRKQEIEEEEALEPFEALEADKEVLPVEEEAEAEETIAREEEAKAEVEAEYSEEGPAEEEPEEEEPEEEEPEEEEAPASPPKKEEGTVRCVFCGAEMSRDSQVCPRCGKKR